MLSLTHDEPEQRLFTLSKETCVIFKLWCFCVVGNLPLELTVYVTVNMRLKIPICRIRNILLYIIEELTRGYIGMTSLRRGHHHWPRKRIGKLEAHIYLTPAWLWEEWQLSQVQISAVYRAEAAAFFVYKKILTLLSREICIMLQTIGIQLCKINIDTA
jgi:hypothetical protein